MSISNIEQVRFSPMQGPKLAQILRMADAVDKAAGHESINKEFTPEAKHSLNILHNETKVVEQSGLQINA